MAPAEAKNPYRSSVKTVRLVAPTSWTTAFVLWIALGGLSLHRFTVLFWVLTGLVAFTVGRRPWWRAPLDWAPFIGLFLVYAYTRGAATSVGLPTLWELPARFDHALFGEVPSVWLQERMAAPDDAVPWWESLLSVVYLSFFVVPFVLAAALWLRSRVQFTRFMVRFAVVSGIAVLCYVLVPAAPPWAAARCTHAEVADRPSNPACMEDNHPTSREDTVLRALDNDEPPLLVRRITARGFSEIPGLHLTEGFIETGIDSSNPVAAVPSLHAAEAMLVSAFAWPLVRRRWRPLLALYPPAMAFALVWGGDHYVFDVLLGWALVAGVMLGLGHLERRRVSTARTAEPDEALA